MHKSVPDHLLAKRGVLLMCIPLFKIVVYLDFALVANLSFGCCRSSRVANPDWSNAEIADSPPIVTDCWL